MLLWRTMLSRIAGLGGRSFGGVRPEEQSEELSTSGFEALDCIVPVIAALKRCSFTGVLAAVETVSLQREVRSKIKVKGSGQECPLHMGIAQASTELRSVDGRVARLHTSRSIARRLGCPMQRLHFEIFFKCFRIIFIYAGVDG